MGNPRCGCLSPCGLKGILLAAEATAESLVWVMRCAVEVKMAPRGN